MSSSLHHPTIVNTRNVEVLDIKISYRVMVKKGTTMMITTVKTMRQMNLLHYAFPTTARRSTSPLMNWKNIAGAFLTLMSPITSTMASMKPRGG